MATKRILVVDDDEFTRNALARLFHDSYDVVVAADAHEALERAQETAPDLVIADVWMPGSDGVAMVTEMKQIEALRRVPVIFLTGQTSIASVARGISAGARHYLTKPVDPEILEEKVHRALAR